MKKTLYALSVLILLAVCFMAGVRFNQRGVNQDTGATAERQIIHYVDPMNPAHITKEPGIAPCGMPMEPVYADMDSPGMLGNNGPMVPAIAGTVFVNLEKQQIIGVQVAEVTKESETSSIRTLGRVKPDESRVFPLIATTDGWLEEFDEGTTGSLVNEGQLLTRIKVYNYDFFSWQQRFLTELGYTNRINMTVAPLSRQEQPRRRITTGAGYQSGLPIPESEVRMIKRGVAISHMASGNRQEPMPGGTDAASPQPGAPHHTEMAQVAAEASTAPSSVDHSQHNMGNMPMEKDGLIDSSRQTNLQYSSKGRLELLDFGLEEKQLDELQANGNYITHVDIRSPVQGYVLERKVFPLQKIERGDECFRIADLGHIWVEADFFEPDVQYIQAGMRARVTMPRQKGEWLATVSDILPRFDPVSRSFKVRLEMDNPEYRFRPNMFVDVEVLVTMPAVVSVPVTAVIDSGKRKTVYVAKEKGIFEPRAVATGWQLNDRVEVVEGLQPGERIVVSGNFLIDSESRMKLSATGVKAGHMAPSPPAESPEMAATPGMDTGMAMEKRETVSQETVDPVCGMKVDRDQASADNLSFELDGHVHWFCSETCKEQFKRDPAKYLGRKSGQRPAISPGHDGQRND